MQQRHVRAEAYTLNYLGRMDAAQGRFSMARRAYLRALTLNQAVADREGESLTRYQLAELSCRQGRWDDAREQIERSLLISESLRKSVAGNTLRISYMASMQRRYEFHVDLLMRMARRRHDKNLEVLALNASERGRARGLLDLVAEARAHIYDGASPDLLKRRLVLEQQLQEMINRQMNAPDAKMPLEEQARLKEDIVALQSKLDALEGEIKAKSPRYAALAASQPMSLERLQRDVLDGQTVLLEYALGEEQGYLWAVTSQGVTSRRLPKRIVIDRLATDLRARLTARQTSGDEDATLRRARILRADAEANRLMARLSRILLRPVASLLQDKRILIAAEGELQSIPFAALPDPVGASSRPLIMTHEVVMEPSASLLAQHRAEPPRQYAKTIAVLANPVFRAEDHRLPHFSPSFAAFRAASRHPDEGTYKMSANGLRLLPLLGAEREAADILAMVSPEASLKATGVDASRDLVISGELKHYKIIHFASHGLIDKENPDFSSIALSLFDRWGQPVDGLLRMRDIYNLDLPVDLVVLSGCETALGRDVRGEGRMALTRGFLYAGASRVIASLWEIDDSASATLIQMFYRNLLGPPKMSPAAALAFAQREWLQTFDRPAPYFWAAFMIQGEYR